jgi:hypothetical protein
MLDNMKPSAGSFLLSCLIHAAILLLVVKCNWLASAHGRLENGPLVTIMPQGTQEARLTFENEKTPIHGDMRVQGFNPLDDKAPGEMDDRLPKIQSLSAVPLVKFSPDIRIRDDVSLSGAPTLDKSLLNAGKGPANAIGGQFYGMGGAGFAGSFGRHMQGVREMGLDVVFIFDATSSMAEFLRQVKTKIANLAMTFKALVPTVRIGLVAYRDHKDDFVTRSFPLTHKTQQLEGFLKDMDPVGGGDHEEALTDGLRVAINEFNWGRDSKKIILVIGDAPPHPEDMQQARELVEKFKTRMNGMVATLDTNSQNFRPHGQQGPAQGVLPEFKELAVIGGGDSARMVDEEKVIKQMVVLVFGTKWESYLDEFLKNL